MCMDHRPDSSWLWNMERKKQNNYFLFTIILFVVCCVCLFACCVCSIVFCLLLSLFWWQYLFSWFHQDKPDVHYYAVPIAIAAVFAYIVSHIFLSVYEVNNNIATHSSHECCIANDISWKFWIFMVTSKTIGQNSAVQFHSLLIHTQIRGGKQTHGGWPKTEQIIIGKTV